MPAAFVLRSSDMLWLVFAGLGFVVMVPLVSFIMASSSGWSLLAEKYRACERPRTPRKVDGGRVGTVTYRGSLSVSAQSGGFTLSVLLPFRIAHPPLFIPWSAVTESESQFMGQRAIAFRVHSVPEAIIELPIATAHWLKSASAASEVAT